MINITKLADKKIGITRGKTFAHIDESGHCYASGGTLHNLAALAADVYEELIGLETSLVHAVGTWAEARLTETGFSIEFKKGTMAVYQNGDKRDTLLVLTRVDSGCGLSVVLHANTRLDAFNLNFGLLDVHQGLEILGNTDGWAMHGEVLEHAKGWLQLKYDLRFTQGLKRKSGVDWQTSQVGDFLTALELLMESTAKEA